MGRPQTEACPSVTALSPVWTCPLSAPPGTNSTGCAQLLVVRDSAGSLGFGVRCGDDMSQLSADDIKPAPAHPLPVLHMPFLTFTVHFKRIQFFGFLSLFLISSLQDPLNYNQYGQCKSVKYLLTASRNMNVNLDCRERCSRLTFIGFKSAW